MNAFKCNICSTIFQNGIEFIKHLKTHVSKSVKKCIDSNNKNEKEEFRCNFCDKRFLSRNNLNIHTKEIHEKRKDFQCEICEIAFSRKSLYSKHMESHDETQKYTNQSYRCNLCEKVFSSQFKLKKHTSGHKLRRNKDRTQKNEFKCTYCDKSYISSYNYRIHIMKIHEKRFQM